MELARYWSRLDDGHVACELCPHTCRLSEGQDGLCHVRGVRDGELMALAYGHLASAGVDPIEKKPLYHFHPGTGILSLGGWGCNFRCAFCQNWEISQRFQESGTPVTPASVMRRARDARVSSIAYTYNEPMVGFEFVYDCARMARQQGLSNVLVTNGYVNPEPAAALLAVSDALNIDIKSFGDEFYRQHCCAHLDPVLAFAEQARSAGCHVEVTTLLIPGHNDSLEEVRGIAHWVRHHLGDTVPLHLSAYFPRYKFEAPPTSGSLLARAYEVARTELTYVYLGNVSAGAGGRDTVCPACGTVQIVRQGYATRVTGLQGGACRGCGRQADLVPAP